MNKFLNRVKLANMLLNLHTVETVNGKLTYEGELNIGTKICLENEGEFTILSDGEYTIEDKTFNVKDGMIESFNEVEILEEEVVEEVKEEPIEEVKEEVVEEPVEEEKVEEVIEEVNPLSEENENLKKTLEDKERQISELLIKIEEQEKLLSQPQAESAHEVAKKNQSNKPIFKSFLK